LENHKMNLWDMF